MLVDCMINEDETDITEKSARDNSTSELVYITPQLFKTSDIVVSSNVWWYPTNVNESCYPCEPTTHE